MTTTMQATHRTGSQAEAGPTTDHGNRQLSLRPAMLSLTTEHTELLDDMPNDDEDSLALFVTSLIDDSVFWNQVFFDDWASITLALSW